MAPRKTLKKVITKGSVIPQSKLSKKEINPHDKWAQMKADFDLDEDEMPPKLAAEIANWDARPSVGKSGLTRGKPNKPLSHILTAEATLKSLQYPLTPQVVKVCKLDDCKDLFRTPYESVAYCSDYCRMQGLAQFGIDWIDDQWSSKNEIELWMGQVPPAIIPESVLSVMKYLVLDSESKRDEPIEPWNPNDRSQALVVSAPIEPAIVQIEPETTAQPESILPQLSVRDRLMKLRADTALGKSAQPERESILAN